MMARRDPGNPYMGVSSGDELHGDTERWQNLHRVIDRERDTRDKVIADPETGQVLYATHERLSDPPRSWQHQKAGERE